ncbi:MAG: hypothetical protein RXR06_06850, partial [Thermoproteus sp.]
LRPPAGVSEDCRTFAYAVYDAVYNNTSPLVKLPEPVISLAASGDGSLGGTEAAEGEAAGGAGTPRERRRDAEYGTDATGILTAAKANGIDTLSNQRRSKEEFHARQTRCAQICGMPWCLAQEVPGSGGTRPGIPAGAPWTLSVLAEPDRICV